MGMFEDGLSELCDDEGYDPLLDLVVAPDAVDEAAVVDARFDIMLVSRTSSRKLLHALAS